VASAGPLGLGLDMTFKRILDNPSPSASPKKGGLLGRIINHTLPTDHAAFEETRRSGFKALRRSLEKRKKQK
jgi:hypothetical protein